MKLVHPHPIWIGAKRIISVFLLIPSLLLNTVLASGALRALAPEKAERIGVNPSIRLRAYPSFTVPLRDLNAADPRLTFEDESISRSAASAETPGLDSIKLPSHDADSAPAPDTECDPRQNSLADLEKAETIRAAAGDSAERAKALTDRQMEGGAERPNVVEPPAATAERTDESAANHALARPAEKPPSNGGKKGPSAPVGGDAGSQRRKFPRPLWGLFWGNLMANFGGGFNTIAQPFLVMGTLGQSKTRMGLIRDIHLGGGGLTDVLPVGTLVDKTDFRTLLIVCAIGRAALMGAIPALFLSGHLTFAAFVVVTALNPLFQTPMLAARSAARKAFAGHDRKLNKEAAATFGKYESLVRMFFPLVAGAGVNLLVGWSGLGGYALAYGAYSAMLLASVPVYWTTIRDPRDPSERRGGLRVFLRESARLPLLLFQALFFTARYIWESLSGRRAPGPTEPKSGLRERLARTLENYESGKGFAHILRNRTLSALVAVGAIDVFLADALPRVILPNFISGLVVGPAAALPRALAMLATSAGAFGAMLAAEDVGKFFASWVMEGRRGDSLINRWGLRRLYRLAAVGSLLFWLMWFFPCVLTPGLFLANVAVVLGVQFGMEFLHTPIDVAMAPVIREEIPDALLGRVNGAISIVEQTFMAVGALAAGVIVDYFSIQTAMLLIATAVTLTAVVEWLAPRWILPRRAGRPERAP